MDTDKNIPSSLRYRYARGKNNVKIQHIRLIGLNAVNLDLPCHVAVWRLS